MSRFLDGTTYRIILIGLLGLVSILVGIYTYDLYQLRNYLPIATLDFPEDKLIKINSARIYSFNQAISPNDQLILMLNVTNKNSTRFYVEPKIYLDVGGEILKKREDLGATQLGINYTGMLPQYTFFAANEGQNNVKVTLVISSFNNTFIKYENATTSFSVLSTSDKLLHDQNNTVLLGVIVSGLVGAAALIFTAIQTLKLREERKLTLRAWIGDIGSKFTTKNVINLRGEIMSYEEWKKLSDPEKQQFDYKNVEIHFSMKNFGTVPAVDVRGRLFTSPYAEPLRAQLDSTTIGDPFVIMPDAERVTRFFLKKEYSEYLLDPLSTSFASLEIKYKSANSNKERLYGISFVRKGDGFSVLKTWDEESRKNLP